MSDSVRILTYNTQLRSWGMEVLAQKTLSPTDSAEKRAERIAERILQSPEDYDVICFNEVFDEDAREVLLKRLHSKYPNVVVKADVDDLALRIAEIAGIDIGAAALFAFPPLQLLNAIGVSVLGALMIEDLKARKFEDSGLMLFSRLPFEPLPLTQEAREFLDRAGFTGDFPNVTFVPYAEAAFDDSLSAKGVLYAKFVLPTRRSLHVLASHTQADPTGHRGQNTDVRNSQFHQVADLIDRLVGPGALTEEVVLCGDFNIDGAFHGKEVTAEWTSRFGERGSKFRDVLEDVWHFHQCPGVGSKGEWLLPDNFDRGATLYARDNQRLDYFLRPVPFPGRLATQHVAIAYDVAQGPSGALTAYTSDHLPLKLDLNTDRPRSSVIHAESIAMVFDHPDVTVNGYIVDGQMDWFCIDADGAYGIRLDGHGGDIGFDVYGPTNLSAPLQPFTVVGEPEPGERGTFGTRYVLPDPPYLIRVFLNNRQSGAEYSLHVHRFLGTSEEDAIPLIAGVPCHATVRAKAPHCEDDPSTPFDDFDSVWFVTQFDADPAGAINVKGTARITDAHRDVFGLLVAGREDPHNLVELAEVPPGPDPVVAMFEYQLPLGGLILVRRREPTFESTGFVVLFETNLNYLYGQRPLAIAAPSLFCEDETDGFLGSESGSDDISFNVTADGKLAVHADHEDDLDFDDDTGRDLDPWINVVRYTERVEFELVELDDLSPVDRASVTIPTYDDLIGQVDIDSNSEPGKAYTAFRIAFDGSDGVYHLKITASKHAPPQ